MTVLSPPPGFDITVASRDLRLAHPDLRLGWMALQPELAKLGYPTLVIEVFRYNARQQWLYGSGRPGHDCVRKGVPSSYARPAKPVVTEAWSAATSAHGYIMQNSAGAWVPAAAAIDVCPVGVDGKPFTADDPWPDFIGKLEAVAHKHGLRHFRNRFGRVTDHPHLQLVAYSDLDHHVVDSSPPPPLAA